MKVLAFAASGSSQSINKKLVTYVTSLLSDADVEILDLRDFELPLFTEDVEKELGSPDAAKAFYDKIGEADAVVISFAEHNGSYSAYYKNLFDWTSRINQKLYQGKPLLLLSTSPGARGGAGVLAQAESSAPFFDGDVVGSLAVPSFYQNFDVESGEVSDAEIRAQLKAKVRVLESVA